MATLDNTASIQFSLRNLSTEYRDVLIRSKQHNWETNPHKLLVFIVKSERQRVIVVHLNFGSRIYDSPGIEMYKCPFILCLEGGGGRNLPASIFTIKNYFNFDSNICHNNISLFLLVLNISSVHLYRGSSSDMSIIVLVSLSSWGYSISRIRRSSILGIISQ